MKAKVITIDNKASGDIDLPDGIYGLEVRPDLLHRMVNYQLAKRRAGTHKVKSRSEIRGTASKIFRQKGGGRARHRNRKAPIFVGGGQAFGPKPRSHAHDLPKKVRKLALKTALSAKMADKKVIILEDDSFKAPKTKVLSQKLEKIGISNALFITGVEPNRNFILASRNLVGIDVLPQQGANVYDILRRDNLVLTREAVSLLSERLG